MKCSKCGYEIYDGATCPVCGHKNSGTFGLRDAGICGDISNETGISHEAIKCAKCGYEIYEGTVCPLCGHKNSGGREHDADAHTSIKDEAFVSPDTLYASYKETDAYVARRMKVKKFGVISMIIWLMLWMTSCFSSVWSLIIDIDIDSPLVYVVYFGSWIWFGLFISVFFTSGMREVNCVQGFAKKCREQEVDAGAWIHDHYIGYSKMWGWIPINKRNKRDDNFIFQALWFADDPSGESSRRRVVVSGTICLMVVGLYANLAGAAILTLTGCSMPLFDWLAECFVRLNEMNIINVVYCLSILSLLFFSIQCNQQFKRWADEQKTIL